MPATERCSIHPKPTLTAPTDLLNLFPIPTLPPAFKRTKLKCAAATSGRGWRENERTNPSAHAQPPKVTWLDARQAQGARLKERYVPTGTRYCHVLISAGAPGLAAPRYTLEGERESKDLPEPQRGSFDLFIFERYLAGPLGSKNW